MMTATEFNFNAGPSIISKANNVLFICIEKVMVVNGDGLFVGYDHVLTIINHGKPANNYYWSLWNGPNVRQSGITNAGGSSTGLQIDCTDKEYKLVVYNYENLQNSVQI